MQVWRADRPRQIAGMYNLCPGCSVGCKHGLWWERGKHKHPSLAIPEPDLSSRDNGLWFMHWLSHFNLQDRHALRECAPFLLPVRPVHVCVCVCVFLCVCVCVLSKPECKHKLCLHLKVSISLYFLVLCVCVCTCVYLCVCVCVCVSECCQLPQL